MSYKEKLSNVVDEEHAKMLLKLYTELINYSNFNNKDFNDTTNLLIKDINELNKEHKNK